MNRFRWQTPFLRQGEGGAGGSETPPPPALPERPKEIPEKFWNADVAAAFKANPKGVVTIAQSYGELEKKQGQIAAEIDGKVKERIEKQKAERRPAKLEDYKLELPNDLKLPPGLKAVVKDDHPMLQWWRQRAYDLGLTQQEFNDGARAYIETEGAGIHGVDKEFAKLGTQDEGVARVKRVDAFIDGLFGQGEDHLYFALSDVVTNADQVIAFEKLMKRMNVEPDMTKFKSRREGGGPGGGNGAVSKEKLRELQNDPRYWRDHDPAIIKQVEDGWKKLAPGMQRKR